MMMENMTWDEFEEVKKKADTVIIPVGSIEAHGKHLPLNTDVLAPVEISKLVERKLNEMGRDILIAPPINYGHTFVLNVYPGTINVKAETLRAYVRDIIEEFAQEGFKKIVLMNGHGGNVYPLIEAAEESVEKYNVEVWLINWWIDFREDILNICTSQGHAGEDETSVIMAIKPELVKMEKAVGEKRKYEVRKIRKDVGLELFPNGVNDDPRGATKEKGEAILEVVSEKIARLLGV
ncbi:creatininase family protein [Palaeococcus sp. (in: euryarchaeotes)]|uniref:creatininase family protein n=1 Tax=Palaeococcus sp. (in: euryarchaeotes) TaxID=2820298 RepID=UPI0025D22A93|nr:creatininase family protein [Palaeococcus sp. (in: euryarchaeotes)]MCD6558328.1 creatininase family protein [Palaeococcus sp. (in: euryarchaeotes)]